MSDKYKNQYRIQYTRLQNWDYRWSGAYFITICTHNRKHFFGEIVDGKMNLSETGKIANKYWFNIPAHFPYVSLGAFIIMPNHVHGIIVIDRNNGKTNNNAVEKITANAPDNDAVIVETLHATSLRNERNAQYQQSQFMRYNKNKMMASISPKRGSVPTIIRSYKSAVTKNARKINPNFAWQSRYWDHIIRNENEYKRISQYIIDNPAKWYNDRLNGVNGDAVMEPPAKYNAEIWMI